MHIPSFNLSSKYSHLLDKSHNAKTAPKRPIVRLSLRLELNRRTRAPRSAHRPHTDIEAAQRPKKDLKVATAGLGMSFSANSMLHKNCRYGTIGKTCLQVLRHVFPYFKKGNSPSDYERIAE